MARNRFRRYSQSVTARPFTQSLGHTAGTPPDEYEPVSLADLREAFSIQPVRPLIRTVLIERSSYQSPPRRGKRESPTAQVRATFRSSQKPVKSPFLNATMVTPQLTERATICARRGIRREVLFATKRTGKGSYTPKRKRSKVRC